MRSHFAKKKKLNEDMALQITSMADIFTILLVFLLKSYSSSVTSISPSDRTKLPEASVSSAEIRDALKLEVSATAVMIDEKLVAKLSDFRFGPNDLSVNGHSTAINRVLLEERRRLPISNQDPNLLVLADQRTPYATIKAILGSAATVGFVDLQLVTIDKE